MSALDHSAEQPRRPLTGRAVLFGFIAFFGVVAGVNAIMLRAATSTFGGVETGSAYKAGLEFKNELAASEAQDALHWRIGAEIRHGESAGWIVDVRASDPAGRPVAGLTATARLAHPADARRDRIVPLSALADGRFQGSADAEAGQWMLVLDFYKGAERMFRSRNRVVLR
jgi:nitrogen fixation protein FixH